MEVGSPAGNQTCLRRCILVRIHEMLCRIRFSAIYHWYNLFLSLKCPSLVGRDHMTRLREDRPAGSSPSGSCSESTNGTVVWHHRQLNPGVVTILAVCNHEIAVWNHWTAPVYSSTTDPGRREWLCLVGNQSKMVGGRWK